MKEEQIMKLGFELEKEYNHDEWVTRRFKKGCMEVEFTYGWEGLVSCGLTLDKVIDKPITLDQLKALSKILN